MNWVNRRQSMNIASLWTWVCTCLVVPSLLGMYCGPGYVHVLLSPHYWVCTVGLGMYMSCCPLTIGYVLWAWVCTCLVVPSLLGMYCGPGYVHVLLSPHYWVCTVGLGMYMSCCPLTIGYVLWAWVCTCLVPSLLGMYCGPGYVHVVPSLLGMYCRAHLPLPTVLCWTPPGGRSV